jgi:hypothetical protein
VSYFVARQISGQVRSDEVNLLESPDVDNLAAAAIGPRLRKPALRDVDVQKNMQMGHTGLLKLQHRNEVDARSELSF